MWTKSQDLAYCSLRLLCNGSPALRRVSLTVALLYQFLTFLTPNTSSIANYITREVGAPLAWSVSQIRQQQVRHALHAIAENAVASNIHSRRRPSKQHIPYQDAGFLSPGHGSSVHHGPPVRYKRPAMLPTPAATRMPAGQVSCVHWCVKVHGGTCRSRWAVTNCCSPIRDKTSCRSAFSFACRFAIRQRQSCR